MSQTEFRISAVRAFVQSAGAKTGIIAVNAATGILTARMLAPSGRGELSAMILWYILLPSCLSLGLPSALTYQLRSYPERRSELCGAALLLSVSIGLLAAFIGFVGLPAWIPQYSPQVLLFSRIFLIICPVTSFFAVARAAAESLGKFSPSNASLIGPPLITLTALVVLMQVHRFTPINAAWCYALAGIPSMCWMIAALRRLVHPRLAGFGAMSRQLFAYGIRSYGIDLCGTMSVYVDQALVIHILRPSFMGTYVVALSLSRMLNVFHTAVVMVLFPKAVSRPVREVIEMTGRAVRMTTVLTTICGTAIILAGPHLLVLLYGSDYAGAAAILRILVIEVILSGATQVMSQAFMALGRPGVITALQAFGLSLTVPLMFILVPRLGLQGAALSLLLSTSARFLFVLASFSRFLATPCPSLIPRQGDFRTVASGMLRRWRTPQPSVAGEQL